MNREDDLCRIKSSKHIILSLKEPKILPSDRSWLIGYSLVSVVFNVPCLPLSTTNKMQSFIIFFIIVNALHVSDGFSAHHQELKNCIHSIWYCQACLLLPLAIAASKPGTYQMLCVQLLSSWWGAEKPPETCRALTVTLTNTASGSSK